MSRPFACVEAMNEEMVTRWSSAVHKDDIVFHLGDFCYDKADEWIYILERLKGRIYFILGNHDVEYITEDIAIYFEGIAAQLRPMKKARKFISTISPFFHSRVIHAGPGNSSDLFIPISIIAT